ncbi:uncharacterized protein LOC134856002 [Symsagittifera roscoffensis]|uniref:uncharacterized protein LOC134856002 n=1 Tax=Symsagittifera roscoffensis TaxID=84072 RepID=UPI00307B80A9
MSKIFLKFAGFLLLATLPSTFGWYDYDVDYDYDYRSYWLKKRSSSNENKNGTEEEKRTSLRDNPNGFMSGAWEMLPIERMGLTLKDIQLELWHQEQTRNQLNEIHCEPTDPFLKSVYYNQENIEEKEMLFELNCFRNHYWVWTKGDPPRYAYLV